MSTQTDKWRRLAIDDSDVERALNAACDRVDELEAKLAKIQKTIQDYDRQGYGDTNMFQVILDVIEGEA